MENRVFGSETRSGTSFLGGKSTFIRTAKEEEEEDFSRSRIQHLPSYRRRDLSGRLEFVVVFQTIEIERLSNEIESLRVMLKDSERQIHNYKNYEVQIKELTENCHLLESQHRNYQDQAEQMSLACNRLYEEMAEAKRHYEADIEEMRRRMQQCEGEWARENEALRQKLRLQDNQLAAKEEEERMKEGKVKAVSQELVRLNQNMLEAQNELKGLKQAGREKDDEMARCLDEVQRWRQEADNQKDYRAVLEDRLQKGEEERKGFERALQKAENKLGQQLEEQEKRLRRDCDALRQRESDMVSQLGQWKDKAQAVLDDNDAKSKELQQAERFNESMKQEYDTLRAHCEGVMDELQRQQQENQGLNQVQQVMGEQLGNARAQYDEMAEFARALRERVEEKAQEVEQMKGLIGQYQGEWERKAQTQQELSEQIDRLQPILSENAEMKDEIIQMGGLLTEREAEISLKQREMDQLAAQLQESEYARRQLEGALRQREEEMKEQQGQFEEYRRSMEQELSGLRATFQSVEREKELIREELERVREQGLIKEELKQEVERLKVLTQQQEGQIKRMVARFPPLMKIIAELKGRQEEQKRLQEAYRVLEGKFTESLQMNAMLIDKVEGLFKEIDGLHDEIDRMGETIRQERFNNDRDFPASDVTSSSVRAFSSVNTLKESMTFKDPAPVRAAPSPITSPLPPRQPKVSNLASPSTVPFPNSKLYESSVKLESSTTSRPAIPTLSSQSLLAKLGKSKSILGSSQQRKVLEPSGMIRTASNNFGVPRDSSKSYLLSGSWTQRDSPYGLPKRQFK